jgi:hypothetical protein
LHPNRKEKAVRSRDEAFAPPRVWCFERLFLRRKSFVRAVATRVNVHL